MTNQETKPAKPREWTLMFKDLEAHVLGCEPNDFKAGRKRAVEVIDRSAFDAALKRASLAEQDRDSWKSNFTIQQEAANKRIAELEAANDNCISLLLHEARVKNLEEQHAAALAELEAAKNRAADDGFILQSHEGTIANLKEQLAAALETRDVLYARVDELTLKCEAVTKAKQENDERFMIERDEARAEVERLKKMLEYERAREFPTKEQRELSLGLENNRLTEQLKVAIGILERYHRQGMVIGPSLREDNEKFLEQIGVK